MFRSYILCSFSHIVALFCFLLQEVIDLYGGIVKMLDTGDKVKVDQTHLETVIPAIGE